MAESTALKDYINRQSIRQLGRQIQTAHAQFPLDRFVRASCKGLASLEFTGRTSHIAAVLREVLPDDVPRSLSIIADCLPEPLPYSDGMFSENFWLWPLSDFVRDYGSEHWEESLATCYKLTQCFTAEFAIRPQLQRHPDKTLELLQSWTADSSEHVRRLCSEGPRPRLPWAARLDLPRKLVVPILESMKSDPSRYVQKSVANHLNDLGKEDAAWLLRTMKRWNRSGSGQTRWIVRHALRTQIKEGDPAALAIIGYSPAALKDVELRVTPKNVAIGETVTAQLRLASRKQQSQKLLIDWVLHYARPNRESYRKVFKGKEIDLPPGEPFAWEKSFDMTPRNTRSLHPGKHRLEVQANGSVVAAAEFRITK